jgi:ribonuclease E
MANKMLTDATHPEETRVVVVRGNRVEEFDFESASRRQLKGNIYLAKVTRVEPSLQAAFVDYGGNRHGFLAFSEIHPDYYQIPVADRLALIAEEERAHRAADAELDRRANQRRRPAARAAAVSAREAEVKSPEVETEEAEAVEFGLEENESTEPVGEEQSEVEPAAAPVALDADVLPIEVESIDARGDSGTTFDELAALEDAGEPALEIARQNAAEEAATGQHVAEPDENGHDDHDGATEEDADDEEAVESVGGGDAMEEVPERMPRVRRQYKIQEVIKRRQIMLVQVVKEERGTKGAALTTYLSLAGRYSVLMPNTARGGGISRKITNAQDRKRLKDVAQELEVPEGMGVILRTAGANRTKAEIKRDFEYLIRLWETVRDLTLKSTAPTLVYEEGSLIKRSIRDLYNKDIDEVLVAGDEAYREAKEFMRMLMPSHAKNVKPYKDSQPIFTRYGVESQLDAMFSPTVQLKSGGYIVLNQTEALVSIDVNSGRATREHHIEDTALKTNLEAAEEIARQLRLRDLAGLIVIDFIDMDEKRNNRSVERRLKDCLKNDRARIQVGRISHFGLLEMSRQRIRSSVLESSTEKCPVCGGTGHMRSVSSVTLQLLRTLEEMLIKGGTHNLIVRTRAEVALYMLNHKRAHLRELEERFRITITVNADATISGPQSFVIDKGEQVHSLEAARALAVQPATIVSTVGLLDEDEDEFDDEPTPTPGEDGEDGQAGERPEGGGRRRRRRRRRRRGEEAEQPLVSAPPQAEDEEDAEPTEDLADIEPSDEESEAVATLGEGDGDSERRRRRRGRRGGRRRRARDVEPVEPPAIEPSAMGASSIEPELDQAVADFDRPPSEADPFPRPEAASASVGDDDIAPSHAATTPIPGKAIASEPIPSEPIPSEPIPTEPIPSDQGEAVPGEPMPGDTTTREPERARRGSTVREPAPYFFGADVAPSSPAPLVSNPASEPPGPAESPKPQTEEPADQPRRTGWWSRRFAATKN